PLLEPRPVVDGVALRPAAGPGSADVLLFPPRSDAMPNRLPGSAFLVAPPPATRVLEHAQTKALTDWANPPPLPRAPPEPLPPAPLRDPVFGGAAIEPEPEPRAPGEAEARAYDATSMAPFHLGPVGEDRGHPPPELAVFTRELRRPSRKGPLWALIAGALAAALAVGWFRPARAASPADPESARAAQTRSAPARPAP